MDTAKGADTDLKGSTIVEYRTRWELKTKKNSLVGKYKECIMA